MGYLSHRGMDADSIVEVLFGYAFEDGDCEPLGDLSSVRTEEVESYHFVVVCLVHDDLSVTVLKPVFIDVPFERLEDTSVCDDVLSSELSPCVFLTVSTAAVFDGGKDSGWNILIAHQSILPIEQSGSK